MSSVGENTGALLDEAGDEQRETIRAHLRAMLRKLIIQQDLRRKNGPAHRDEPAEPDGTGSTGVERSGRSSATPPRA